MKPIRYMQLEHHVVRYQYQWQPWSLVLGLSLTTKQDPLYVEILVCRVYIWLGPLWLRVSIYKEPTN